MFVPTDDIRWVSNDTTSYYLEWKVHNQGKRPISEFRLSSALLFADAEVNILGHNLLNEGISTSPSEIPIYSFGSYSSNTLFSKEKIDNVYSNGFLVIKFKYQDKLLGKSKENIKFFQWIKQNEVFKFYHAISLDELERYLKEYRIVEQMKFE